MLPKLQQSSLAQNLRRDNPATNLQGTFSDNIVEDQLKNFILKSSNESYKPWKNKFAPKNPHSAFGDFPNDYVPRDRLQ